MRALSCSEEAHQPACTPPESLLLLLIVWLPTQRILKHFFIRCFGSLIFKVTSFSVSYTLIHNVHVGSSLLGLSRDSVASVHMGGGHRVKTYCVQEVEGRVGARHFQSDMGISVWFTVQPWNGSRCTRSK